MLKSTQIGSKGYFKLMQIQWEQRNKMSHRCDTAESN